LELFIESGTQSGTVLTLAVVGDSSLEIDRKEPVILSGEYPDWDPGPFREIAQRCCEGAQRLRHEHHVTAPTYSLENQSRIFGQTGVFVVTG
jgi:hypothetical protein